MLSQVNVLPVPALIFCSFSSCLIGSADGPQCSKPENRQGGHEMTDLGEPKEKQEDKKPVEQEPGIESLKDILADLDNMEDGLPELDKLEIKPGN